MQEDVDEEAEYRGWDGELEACVADWLGKEVSRRIRVARKHARHAVGREHDDAVRVQFTK